MATDLPARQAQPLPQEKGTPEPIGEERTEIRGAWPARSEWILARNDDYIDLYENR